MDAEATRNVTGWLMDKDMVFGVMLFVLVMGVFGVVVSLSVRYFKGVYIPHQKQLNEVEIEKERKMVAFIECSTNTLPKILNGQNSIHREVQDIGTELQKTQRDVAKLKVHTNFKHDSAKPPKDA